MAKLPKRNRIEINLELGPSLVGVVQGVAALSRLGGAELDDAEALCISSVAFTTYTYDPAYNPGRPHRDFSSLGEYFTNYGALQALAYYTGFEIRELNHGTATDLFKTVAFEVSAGRPLVTYRADLSPTLITGYDLDAPRRTLFLCGDERVDLAEGADLQADWEHFENWAVMVRPGVRSDWTASVQRQRANVLRWAVEHAGNPKEFFQETGESYAPGIGGLERFAAFLDGLCDPEGVAYAERFVGRQAAARAAAGEVLPGWGAQLAESLGVAAVTEHLDNAARNFAVESELLRADVPLADAIASAFECERSAFESLAAAIEHLPGPFDEF